MAKNVDEHFYERADAHINLSNDQLKEASTGTVSASMLYAAARFNAWVSACGCESADHMAAVRQEAVGYFVEQYRKMLEDNLDDYISHFDSYIAAKK